MLGFKFAFDLPVSRRKSVGTVKGKVYDRRTQAPIGNVILRLNGFTAVTDKWGGSFFPPWPPVPTISA
jgi:hypothetical protein